MKITTAQAQDIPQLVQIWHEGWHQAHGDIVSAALVATRQPDEFTARMTEDLADVRVGRSEQGIAGFYILKQDELYQLYVDPALKGRGVAQALMASVEADLTGRTAWLACTVGNLRAARFYEKCGWHRAETVSYTAPTRDGSVTLDVWRYEKQIG